MGDFGAVLVSGMVFMIPIIAIWTSHQRKMAEIKMRSGNIHGSSLDDVRQQLSALREEVATLRDTSTRFDVSFDAALSRLEQRVDRLDSADTSVAAPSYPAAATSTRAEPDRIIVGSRG